MFKLKCHAKFAGPASMAQLDVHLTGDQEVAGSTPARSATFLLEI